MSCVSSSVRKRFLIIISTQKFFFSCFLFPSLCLVQSFALLQRIKEKKEKKTTLLCIFINSLFFFLFSGVRFPLFIFFAVFLFCLNSNYVIICAYIAIYSVCKFIIRATSGRVNFIDTNGNCNVLMNKNEQQQQH